MIPTVILALIAASLFAAGEFSLLLSMHALLHDLPRSDFFFSALFMFVGAGVAGGLAQLIYNDRKD